MQKNTLENTLISSGIQTWRAYKSIGSTNDEALAWVDEEAPDFSLVIAEEQTSGRGRFDRLWISKAGACLAFSLILRPRPEDHPNLALYAPLCGIAVRDALAELFDLDIQIKWPNDVLISRRKCCGILVESVWTGDVFKGLVMGIGINITADSLPPSEDSLYPATSLEEAVNRKVDGLEVLGAVLRQIEKWRHLVGSPKFFTHWKKHLAYMGEEVMIVKSEKNSIIGIEKGIDRDGNLLIIGPTQKEIKVEAGDVHLRPLGKP